MIAPRFGPATATSHEILVVENIAYSPMPALTCAMSTLHRTNIAPKRFAASFDLDSRAVEEPLDDILNWIKDMLSGTVHWRATQFRDPAARRTPFHPVRQRHFKDGYFIYTFWLGNHNDALIFKLRFSRIG